MHSSDSVCVSVCVRVSAKYLRKLLTNFDEILWRDGAWSVA